MKLGRLLLALIMAAAMAMPAAAAQPQPVEMAAEVIEYNSTTGIMTGTGGVRFTRDGAVLTGAAATYNTRTKEGHVTGGVKMVQSDAVLTAEELRSYDNNRITASGGVQLTKGESVLTGPQLDYYTDKAYAVVNDQARLVMQDGVMTAGKIEAYLDESRITGTGSVHIVSQARQLDATADQAVYYGAEPARAVLTGNARAVQEGNILTGNKLTIYLDNQTVNAQGRTQLVIQPQ
ncbi:lipopolysaccharide export system protein LptA [Dendrosporobacter quercicolus]|uniref:Lipopolysaccharide export system protein LptA n=1 Tax=Dendrosporobacter quercicolus TaxID=146817 RepID=A0A1G9WLA9_9FIRM|nr:LptA/OstA family protein [Dendrosporobacter quercicolus]SDM85127.1 lipopolysaccharide export system protein LptA [Dendrosporobacter quercicolus]